MTPIERFYLAFIEKEMYEESFYCQEYTDAILLMAEDYSGKKLDDFEKKLKDAVVPYAADKDSLTDEKVCSEIIPEIRAKVSCPELEEYLNAEWNNPVQRAERLSKLIKDGKLNLIFDDGNGVSYDWNRDRYHHDTIQSVDIECVDYVIPNLIAGVDVMEENKALFFEDGNSESVFLAYEMDRGFVMAGTPLTDKVRDNLKDSLDEFIFMVKEDGLDADSDHKPEIDKLIKKANKDLKEDKGKEIGD